MLKTSFICILTSGHTIDGREVSAKTLTEMAETYDPKVYNAIINIEHSRYGSKLGSVLSLKVEDFGDNQKKLFAELKPNDFFLYLNQLGQKLHTSVELLQNFAKTGKAYLTGLAVTDSPASLGTTEIKLSVNGDQVETFSTGEIIEPDEKPTFSFKKLLAKEDNNMDKAVLELLTQMQAQTSKTAEAIESLTAQIGKLTADKTEPKDTPKDTENKDEQEQELSEMKTQLTALAKTVEDTVDVLKKLSEQTDEEFRHQATGGNTEESEVIL